MLVQYVEEPMVEPADKGLSHQRIGNCDRNARESCGRTEEPAVEGLSPQRPFHSIPDFSRILHDCHTSGFEHLHLLSRRTFAA